MEQDGLRFKAGDAPFPCVNWYRTPGTTIAVFLTDEQKSMILGQLLGGNGYAGDKRFSENLNNLLEGRELTDKMPMEKPAMHILKILESRRGPWPYGNVEGWSRYGGTELSLPNQILTFAKQLAETMNEMPNTAITVIIT